MASLSKHDQARVLSVHALASSGDLDGAMSLAMQALQSGLEHPLIFNLAALQSEREGNLLGALALLDRGLALSMDDPGSLNARGLLLMRLERAADAIACFDRMIALDPSPPFVHVNRGNALQMLGELAAAEDSYRQALVRDECHPIALAGLSTVLSQRGDHLRARRAGEQALLLAPGLADAALSVVAADLADGQLAAAEVRVRALLQDPTLGTLDACRAEGLLGDVLDAKGSLSQAYDAYLTANQRLQQHYAPQFAHVRPTALEYARDLTAQLTQRGVSTANLTRSAEAAGQHVFLVGFPRSGTTLLEIALNGHPAVVSLEEKELMIEAVRVFMRTPHDIHGLERASDVELDRLRQCYWEAVRAEGLDVSGKVFVDKYPLNLLKWPLIARLFPKARVLFALRDPRDVVLSCFRRQFRMNAPMFEMLTLQGTAAYYDAVMALADCCRDCYPLPTLVVRHESLVADFRPVMEAVADFLGLEWHQAMDNFSARAVTRAFATPSTAQLASGLQTHFVGQWRRYHGQLLEILPILEPWVAKYQYPMH